MKETHNLLIPASRESTHWSFLNTSAEIQQFFCYAISTEKSAGKGKWKICGGNQKQLLPSSPAHNITTVMNQELKGKFLKTITAGQWQQST